MSLLPLGSSLVYSAYVQSDLFGKSIFLLLIFLSVISWVVIVNKILLAKKINRLTAGIEHYLAKHKEELLQLKWNHFQIKKHPLLQIIQTLQKETKALLHKNEFFLDKKPGERVYLSSEDMDTLYSHADMTINKEVKSFENNLFVLSTIVTLAPFLGLLGTVWGILLTFSQLQTISSGNAAMLTGLSMALGTTVLGLIVAIPALIGHNYLKYKTAQHEKELQHFSHSFLTTVEMQYRSVEKQLC